MDEKSKCQEKNLKGEWKKHFCLPRYPTVCLRYLPNILEGVNWLCLKKSFKLLPKLYRWFLNKFAHHAPWFAWPIQSTQKQTNLQQLLIRKQISAVKRISIRKSLEVEVQCDLCVSWKAYTPNNQASSGAIPLFSGIDILLVGSDMPGVNFGEEKPWSRWRIKLERK